MTTRDEAIKAVAGVLSTKQNSIEWQTAMLGDGHGTVSTGDNTVYCRLTANSSVVEVLNYRVAPVDGLLVRIAKTPEMPLHWQVIGQADQRADEGSATVTGGIIYNTPPHHKLHEYLGVDQVNIDWRQINTLRVYAYSGFTIGVIAGLLPRPGADLVVPTQTLDLTTHIPAAGALFVLISVDSTGALVATDGATASGTLTLTLGDIPDTPSGNFRLAAVRLYTGQTAISESTQANDIRDLRWPQERLASSISPADITLANQHFIVGNASNVGSDAGAGVTYNTTASALQLVLSGQATALDYAQLVINANTGKQGQIIWQTGGADKWTLYTPTGSNDLRLYSYALVNDLLTFTSSSGKISQDFTVDGQSIPRDYTRLNINANTGKQAQVNWQVGGADKWALYVPTGSNDFRLYNYTTPGDALSVDSTTNTVSVDALQFDLTPTSSATAEGRMVWNVEDGTLNLGMPGGSVNLQIGQELIMRAKNTTGAPITNGQLVYISSGTGNNAIISLAKADAEITSATTIGMATEAIADNHFGYVTLIGLVRDVNTIAYTAGTSLYLSASTAGAYTSTKPTAPNHLVTIGVVIRQHATDGVIFVRIDNGYELSELHDVYINSIADGNILQYVNANSRWENKTLASAGLVSGSGTAGQIAYWSGTSVLSGENELFWDAANNRLGIGTATPGYAIDAIATGSGAIRLAENATNSTTKFGRFITRHYTNAEEDFIGFNITSTAAAGIVQFGGGSGIFNTATLIQFYTAANNTTLTGTERMSIDSAGYGRFFGDYTANRVGVGSIFTQASPAAIATPLHVSVATAGSWQAVTIQNGNSATNDTADIDFRMTSAAVTTGRIGAARVGASAITDLVFHTYNGSLQERMRIDNVGLTTIKANNATTNAADAVLTLGHNSTGTPAQLFGLRTSYTLESSTTADQVAGYEDRLWTDPTHASRTALYRGTTTGNAANTGFYGAWAHNAVSNTAITIIPNGTGDVASVGTFVFTVKDNTSATTNGGIVVVNPGGGAISLLSDGTDTLQITCAADGSVTIARSAGTHTFAVSLWGTWQ